jgi:hypothetical protein
VARKGIGAGPHVGLRIGSTPLHLGSLCDRASAPVLITDRDASRQRSFDARLGGADDSFDKVGVRAGTNKETLQLDLSVSFG